MGKTVIPAKPASTIITCDHCGKEDRYMNKLDFPDRDYSNAVVYGHEEYYCENCLRSALDLLRALPKG